MKLVKRVRRCELSVPGSSEKMMAKASAMNVDFVFLDLEDSVAPTEKREARQKVIKALTTLDWGRKTRCVRINDLSTEYAYEDIVEVVEGARENLDSIMLPKVMCAADVQFVDRLLTMIEKKVGLTKRIGIEVLIEEVQAIVNVEEIAAASSRLEALIFGMGDYAASQGVSMRDIGGSQGYPGDIWHYQRHRVTIAARANGIDAVDGPYGNFRDLNAYREECRRAMILGMVGKWAIHPSQVEVAQEIFSPDAKEVERARAMIAAYDEALSQGLGAVQFEGKMIDIASIRIVRNLVDRATLIGI